MVRNAFSRILHQVAHSCSGFGLYFANVQSGNCRGCPDCRCGEGPSVEEARKEYLAMQRSLLRY